MSKIPELPEWIDDGEYQECSLEEWERRYKGSPREQWDKQQIHQQAFQAGLRSSQMPINKRETPEQQDARIKQLRQNPNRRTPQIDE